MGKLAAFLILAAGLVFLGQACEPHHTVDPYSKIEVAPMHITIDVNVRVDKALEEYFGDLDKAQEKIQKP
jgi:hypothetical protein